jgi:hypothetical protein
MTAQVAKLVDAPDLGSHKYFWFIKVLCYSVAVVGVTSD